MRRTKAHLVISMWFLMLPKHFYKVLKKSNKNFVQCQIPVQEYVKLGHWAICFSMKDKHIGYITIVRRTPYLAYWIARKPVCISLNQVLYFKRALDSELMSYLQQVLVLIFSKEFECTSHEYDGSTEEKYLWKPFQGNYLLSLALFWYMRTL